MATTTPSPDDFASFLLDDDNDSDEEQGQATTIMSSSSADDTEPAVHPKLQQRSSRPFRCVPYEVVASSLVLYAVFYDACVRLKLPYFGLSLLSLQIAVYFAVMEQETRTLRNDPSSCVVVGRVIKRWTNTPNQIVHYFVVQYCTQGKVYQKKFKSYSLLAEEKYFDMWIPSSKEGPLAAQLKLVVDRLLFHPWASQVLTATYVLFFTALPFYCLRYDATTNNILHSTTLNLHDVVCHYLLAGCAFPVTKHLRKKLKIEENEDAVLLENEDPREFFVNRSSAVRGRIDQRLLLPTISSNFEILLRNVGFAGCVAWLVIGQFTSGLEYYWCLFIFAMVSAGSIASLLCDMMFVAPLRRQYRSKGIQLEGVEILRTLKLSNLREGPDTIIEYKCALEGRVLTVQKRLPLLVDSYADLDETGWRILPGKPWSAWHESDNRSNECVRLLGFFLSPCIIFSFATFDVDYGVEFWFQVTMTTPLIALLGVACLFFAYALSTRQTMLGEGVANTVVVGDSHRP